MEKKPTYFYKEIVRVRIGENRHMIISLRSDGRLSISTTMSAMTDETDDRRLVDMHKIHAIPIFRTNLIQILYAVSYVVLRLGEHEIAEEDKVFVENLRAIFKEPQERIIKQMIGYGHPPRNFRGQAYNEYQQDFTGR
jgi:methyl coenzyme M reductase alpha subunit